jgi:formylglycine-generating enzyme required for sulfatase activity
MLCMYVQRRYHSAKMKKPLLVLLALSALMLCFFRSAYAQGAEPTRPTLNESLGQLFQPAMTNKSVSSALAGAPVGTNPGRRVALVLGNGDYRYPENLPKLDNPTNDAEDISAILRRFGFEVIERKNQTLEAMNQAIAEFGRKAADAEAAIFYFAGHGIQVKNQNYLMPIDARVESEAVVPYQGVNINQILDEMDNAKSAANIVMLDACRNNPITGKFRSGRARGLATPGNVPKGTVIVFATDPGNVAADGDGRNGLFTSGLLTAFKGTDLSLDEVLTVASAEVERASGNTQTPYVNGPKTLQKNFHFRLTVNPGTAQIEKTFWLSIEKSTDSADFDAYLRKYPSGNYKAIAENRLKQLKQPLVPEKAVITTATLPSATPVVPAASTKNTATTSPISVLTKSGDTEATFWVEVKSSGAKEYYEAYLEQYPKGKFVRLAKDELKTISDEEKRERARQESDRKAKLASDELERTVQLEREWQAQLKSEQEAWNAAKKENTVVGYADYLAKYPHGRFAKLATVATQKAVAESAERERTEVQRRERAASEAAARVENEHWQKVLKANDSLTVQSYLTSYPSGLFVSEARVKLAEVKKKESALYSLKIFKDCADCPDMVELPNHHIAFGVSPITQGQWRALMESNPSFFNECGDDCPVEQVSWNDTQAYLKKINDKTGKSYRLPTANEWRLACKSGQRNDYCGSDNINEIAWYGNNGTPGGNSSQKTHPVKRKQPNAWGLFDMTGNVWVWVQDCQDGDCDRRLLLGGSWDSSPDLIKSRQLQLDKWIRLKVAGFRIVRSMP